MIAIRTWLDSRAASRLVQILVVISLMIGLYVTVQQRDLAQCQVRYAEAAATSQAQRAQAAGEDRAAMDAMVTGVVNAKTPGEPRRALLTYLAARKAADERRARNPAPEPPSKYCG